MTERKSERANERERERKTEKKKITDHLIDCHKGCCVGNNSDMIRLLKVK